MKRSFATALTLALFAAGACTPVSAQTAAAQCNAFSGLKSDAEQKALAVRTAMEHKAERKQICALVQRFAAAEESVVKFLERNQSWCGIPQQAITAAKTNHERTLKFRTMACAEAPAARPRPPSLSEAIGTPAVDTGENTRTGRGTLDSLTGNPLAR
jgi:hypothetical protein